MQLTPVQRLSKHLNDYLFHKVWNCTESEYRGNILARCMTPKAISNRLIIPGGTIVLPDNNPYYIYSIPQVFLKGLRVRTCSWEKLSAYLNNNYLDLRLTTQSGKWLYRDNVYVAGHPTEKAFLLAVHAGMFNAIAEAKYDVTKLFVSVYYDSNKGSSVTSKYMIVKTEGERAQALNLIREEDNNLVFINGQIGTNVNFDQVRLGDYIEVVKDPDVFADFTINLTDEDECRFYKSAKSGTFNYIVHIPRHFNPDNILVTHNQVDFYIRPINGVNPNIKGHFIHRFNTKDLIGQLTHNDFWISEKLIQAYMTGLNTTDVELRVVCRYGRVNQTLIEDCNYVNLLYDPIHSDKDILDFLEGKRDEVPYWKATHLENSEYNRLMFESILNNPIDGSTISNYINAIGYYNVMDIVSSRIITCEFPYNLGETVPNYIKDFDVRLPINLHAIKNVHLNIWVDGVLQGPNDYTTRRISKDIVNVAMSGNKQFPNTASVVVEVFEDAFAKAEYITCSEHMHEIPTGDEEIEVYQVTDLMELPWTKNYLSKSYKVDHAYKKVNVDEIAKFEEGYLVFNREVYGKTYLVVTKNAFIKMNNIDYTIDEIRGNVVISGPITIDLPCFSNNSITKKVPLLWDVFPIVYVNDKELARDIDFSFNVETTDSGEIICKTININNTQYFKTFELLNTATNWYTEEPNIDGSIEYRFQEGSFLITDKGKITLDTDDISATIQLVKILDKDPSEYGEIVDSDGSLVITSDTPKDIYLINKKEEYNEIVGLSLVNKSSGVVKAYFTTDVCFNYFTDFLIDNVSTKRDLILYYHPSLSVVTVDGVPVNSVYTDKYGRFVPEGEHREGGFVYLRSMVPHWLFETMNQYGDKSNDINTLNTILKYFEKVNPHDYPDKVVLPYSHHITSVVLNAVIRDIVDGKFTLVYDPSDESMLSQISEYMDIKHQDAGLVGLYCDIYADGADFGLVNTHYKLLDLNVQGSARIWNNFERDLQIRYVGKSGNKPGRWVIENTENKERYYHAIDRTGSEDPWNLNWVVSSSELGGKAPILRGGQINLRFIDFDSSYAEITNLSIDQVKAIKRLAEALLPVDSATDMKE